MVYIPEETPGDLRLFEARVIYSHEHFLFYHAPKFTDILEPCRRLFRYHFQVSKAGPVGGLWASQRNCPF